MFNKKIIISGISILTAIALMGGATYAFFSSSATSTGNVFGAGTLVLELDDANEAFGNDLVNDVTATFSVPNMAPGDSVAQNISFHNDGSVDIAEIAMGLTATNTDAGPNGSDLRNKLNLKVVAGGTVSGDDCTGGTDVTGTIDSLVGDNLAPLTMTEFNGDAYDSLPIALVPTTTNQVCIRATFDSGATDIYQGDSANATFTFTAHQNVSQI